MSFSITIETPDKSSSWMKKKPIQSGLLAGGKEMAADPSRTLEKIAALHGQSLWVKDVFMDRERHVRVVFAEPAEFKLGGKPYIWEDAYFYAPHIKGISDIMKAKTATAAPNSAAGQRYILLPTWYLQQNNNLNRGQEGGSSLRAGNVQCGLTSLAMALTAVWPIEKIRQLIKEAQHDQFETWLQDQFIKIGAKSIEMEGHVAVLKHLGIKATCRRDATLGQLKEALKKHPVVVGFEYKESGHFNCITGYIDQPTDKITIATPVGTWENKKAKGTVLHGTGFITQDPYGERDWSGSGNNWIRICDTITDDFGMHNFVPDAVMDDFWASTNQGWAVFFDPSVPVLGGVGPTPIVLPAPAPPVSTGAPETGVPIKQNVATDSNSITITNDTWLKKRIANASDLPDSEKRFYKAGSTLVAEVTGAKSGHGVLKFEGETWYVFNLHFKGQEAKAGTNAVGRTNADAPFPVDKTKFEAAMMKLANPNVPDQEIKDFCKAMYEFAAKYTITKREHLIHFLAQCLHESGGLMYLEELASGVDYDDRDDLGNCEPEALAAAARAGINVGSFYKGHSLIQTTGYNNHKKYGAKAGIDAVNNPQKLAEYPHALGAALFFWSDQGPSLSVDAEGGLNDATCTKISKVVNGGTNGLDDRLHYMYELSKLI